MSNRCICEQQTIGSSIVLKINPACHEHGGSRNPHKIHDPWYVWGLFWFGGLGSLALIIIAILAFWGII